MPARQHIRLHVRVLAALVPVERIDVVDPGPDIGVARAGSLQILEVMQVGRERGRKIGAEKRSGQLLRALLRLRPEGEHGGKAGRVGMIIGKLRIGSDAGNGAFGGRNAVRRLGDNGGMDGGARRQIAREFLPRRGRILPDDGVEPCRARIVETVEIGARDLVGAIGLEPCRRVRRVGGQRRIRRNNWPAPRPRRSSNRAPQDRRRHAA